MDLRQLQRDPVQFRQSLTIDADGRSVRLGDVLDDWQDRDFRSMDPAWQKVAGFSREDCTQRFWLERGRGHSKSSDIATMCCWALFASRRPIKGIAAAADKDQAAILRNAIQRLVQLNSWLGKIIKITQNRITNTHTHSECEIISSDAPSSYGALSDFVIADELCHWPKNDLWVSLLSTAAKRQSCLLVVISNAGVEDSWQWELRKQVQADPDWHFSRLDGPVASWIDSRKLHEQRRLLPSISFERLWENRWVPADGEAALHGYEIERAILGEDEEHRHVQQAWSYCAGVDLGLKRDSSAIVVLGKHIGSVEEREIPPKLSLKELVLIESGVLPQPEPTYERTVDEASGDLMVCHVKLWEPVRSNSQLKQPVSIENIEQAIIELDQRYRFTSIACDPWQCHHMIQRLQSQGLPASEVPFSGPNLNSMCSEMLTCFRERKIKLFRHVELLKDLRRMRVLEKSYGARLDFCRNATGHGDAATAMAVALVAAKQIDTTGGRVEGELVAYP